MEEPVEVKLMLEKTDAELLAALAGGEENISEYITVLIRKLYKEQPILNADLRLEELIAEAQVIIDTNEEYRKTIRLLQGRLKNITLSHEELMATIQHLHGTVSRSPNGSSMKRMKH
jgi:hypothetical protein